MAKVRDMVEKAGNDKDTQLNCNYGDDDDDDGNDGSDFKVYCLSYLFIKSFNIAAQGWRLAPVVMQCLRKRSRGRC